MTNRAVRTTATRPEYTGIRYIVRVTYFDGSSLDYSGANWDAALVEAARHASEHTNVTLISDDAWGTPTEYRYVG